MRKNIIKLIVVILSLSLVFILFSCEKKDANITDYSDLNNWAYFEADKDKPVDVFFISPTSILTDDEVYIAEVNPENNKANLNSINMEKGIYDDNARFFSPYYTQITLSAYKLDEEERLKYLDECFKDIDAAFSYYLENINNDRPFIIAGFSQGGEHALKLVEKYSNDLDVTDKMIAAYIIGWRVTDDDLTNYPNLKMATASNDIGVIVSFECESEDTNGTFIVPEGTKTYGINPLNWSTNTGYVLRDYNLGACFTDYNGNIVSEIPLLCGGRLDIERGTLKVTDISKEDYPEYLFLANPGCYHIYDYQFFYRNLEINVLERINTYLNR